MENKNALIDLAIAKMVIQYFFANSNLTTQNEDIIIKTRGGGGLNGGNNSPLYVVDGIPLDTDPKLKS